MSMGPKKKYEYFDGGRGIDMSESYEEEEEEEETTKPLRINHNPLIHGEPLTHHNDRNNYPPLFHHHHHHHLHLSHHHQQQQQQQHSPLHHSPLLQHSPPLHSPLLQHSPPLHHSPLHHHSPPLHHHLQLQHLPDVMTESAYNYSGLGECGGGRFQTPTVSPVIASSPIAYLPPSSGSPKDGSSSPPHYPRDYQPPTSIPSSPTGYGVDSVQEFPALPPPSYSPQGATADLTLGGSSEFPQLPSPNSSRDDECKKMKRKQRCRLCANHDIYAEVKGHKWYCPYRDPHQCEKCEITRKRQYYMAEQQKLTREQQQQQTGGGGVLVAPVPPPQPEPTTITPNRNSRSIKDFPRLEELVKETSNIYSDDLFQQINKIVRPKAVAGQYGRPRSQQ